MALNQYLCGHRMSRQQFFRCFIPAYQAGLTPDAIRKGFQNCGIFPCDRTVPKLKNVGPSTVFDRCKSILRSRWVMFLELHLDDKWVITSG